jgi:regulator of replication initiation timing
MNIHSTANKNKEVESVSTRVKNTKKEIEQLKSELEKLINLGAQPTYTKSTSEAAQPEIINSVTVTVDANRREPQIKKNVPEQPKKVAPVAPKKLEPAAANTSPGKKTRNYNVAEARDYIKKQREKRAEQLKAQINVADNQVDLKKQKLKELHQKTLELVTKNVQLKRERSKSRDKVAPVRLDKANPRQENVSKSRQNVVSKSRERSKQTAPSVRAKSQERTKPQNNERVSRARTRGPPAETVATGAEKIDTNLLYPPVVAPRVDDFEKTVFVPDTAKDEPVDLNKRITSEPPQKQVLEHSIMTDACLKDTKETQTSRRNEFAGAEWMRPPPALSYPYNFINTVKRKLQCAINSPRSCVDVRVQNSVATPPASAAKSREEIRQLLIKSTHSDLRSFASHRAPNLDLEAVENLELKNPKRLDLVSKNLFTNYDSESDTSKNIPEISSESLGSNESKRLLSLDKLKDLKLQMLKKSSQSSVKSDGEDSDSYSSDFQKESIRTSIIRTVTGEKLAPGELSSGNSVTNSTGNNYKVPRESDSKHGEVPSGAVKSQRGDGDSQMTFKSLLTEGQVSKSTTGSIQEMLNSRSVGDSLVLKEPSVVLSLRRDQKSQDLENNRGNNVRVGSSSGSSSESTARSGEHSQGTFKSLLTEGKVSKSSGASISERLDTKDTADGSLRLKPPTLSLSVGREEKVTHLSKSKMKNITIRPAVSNNVSIFEKDHSKIVLLGTRPVAEQRQRDPLEVRSRGASSERLQRVLQAVRGGREGVRELEEQERDQLVHDQDLAERGHANFGRGQDVDGEVAQDLVDQLLARIRNNRRNERLDRAQSQQYKVPAEQHFFDRLESEQFQRVQQHQRVDRGGQVEVFRFERGELQR